MLFLLPNSTRKARNLQVRGDWPGGLREDSRWWYGAFRLTDDACESLAGRASLSADSSRGWPKAKKSVNDSGWLISPSVPGVGGRVEDGKLAGNHQEVCPCPSGSKASGKRGGTSMSGEVGAWQRGQVLLCS